MDREENLIIQRDHLLFVYGTLKKGFGLHKALCDSPFMGPAKIKGLQMFSVNGDYPCVIKGGNQTVKGELYLVPPVIIKVLDRIESSYNRLPLCTTDGKLVEVYVWKYRIDDGLVEIKDGIWR